MDKKIGGVTIEPLNIGFMASVKKSKLVGVGETRDLALERLFAKLPKEVIGKKK